VSDERLGVSGRVARAFQSASLTPLIALVLLLGGLFAIGVTPREEEPQIDVTMANVIVAWPGASAQQVENAVAVPAGQVFSQIAGVKHTYSIARAGLAIVTVQFDVGVPRSEALVKLYDTVQSNQDWLPRDLGALPPVVKPKGIDDVPILALTLYATDPSVSPYDLERVAHAIEADLKRVRGTRTVVTVGGPGRSVRIEPDIERLKAFGLTLADLSRALGGAHAVAPAADLVAGNRALELQPGQPLLDARELADVVVAVRAGKPVSLRDVAVVTDGAPVPAQSVWHAVPRRGGEQPAGAPGVAPARAALDEFPAVTVSITKQPGANAVDVAQSLRARLEELRNTVIPEGVGIEVVRDYGATANDKANTLIRKLLFATASVVALVFFALGWREAAIVGVAVVLTLLATLFASWAWGFTLNRVSLFALIFSIGILVDDAIVVVENIHRHRALDPAAPLTTIIPRAVDEVGGPTILATLTVIAALLPMAFVTGLMGPYMSPIPINASLGMALSLAIAFVITPWLARKWLPASHDGHDGGGVAGALRQRLDRGFERIFAPLLDASGDGRRGRFARRVLWLGVAGLIAVSLALPVFGLVVLKMLPFDNKSEFELVVEMPTGTPLEKTAAVVRDLADTLAAAPEVRTMQAYVGLSAPITFNGLVRQYDLRGGGELAELQVNLVDKSLRSSKSHTIAARLRPALQEVARRHGATLQVVEVPPGPPVLAPIVAEVYGPDEASRESAARAIRSVYEKTEGIVDVDDSLLVPAQRVVLAVDRRKAMLSGVTQADLVAVISAAVSGQTPGYLQDGSKYPPPFVVRLSDGDRASPQTLLSLPVRTGDGRLAPVSEFVTLRTEPRDPVLMRKDGLPVVYVTADMAGKSDSPLYGMFAMREAVLALPVPGGIREYFISQPTDPYRGVSLKWDGEWQITYETFRDMGAAYAVGLVLIYLLVVAHFGSYLTPLVIMAPIPLTIIGVMPGHALLGAPFTATSMIGMIALAGIIVRNSILLVDFIREQHAAGVPFERAVVGAAQTRAQPIVLTGLAAMAGAFFILDDPIFNGLAISLIFGILVSTVLTLVVIPTLYYVAFGRSKA